MTKIQSRENAQLPTFDSIAEKSSSITRRMLLKATVRVLALTPFGFFLLAEHRTPQEYRIGRYMISTLPEKNQATFLIIAPPKPTLANPPNS
ncbi:MAG: hypothetical protein ACE5R6_09700 [Candidatus Heimdallarchaeota archaeon]